MKQPQGLHDTDTRTGCRSSGVSAQPSMSLAHVRLGAAKLAFCLGSAAWRFATLGGIPSVLSLIFFSSEMVVTVLRCQLLKVTDVKRAWCVLVCVTSTEMIVKPSQFEYQHLDKTA